jgi:hypothetical protein
MKHSTEFRCPMVCGYFSESGLKLEYHLFNNCPKKLLINKNFTLCKLNPSILVSDKVSHFSTCEECRQYTDKNKMIISSNEKEPNIEKIESNTNYNKFNYSSFMSIKEKFDDSQIPSKDGKTDC